MTTKKALQKRLWMVMAFVQRSLEVTERSLSDPLFARLPVAA